MNKSNRFSPEVRERAVRMVQEHRGEYPSLWAAIESIAPKIGCVPQTLHGWVRRHEVDSGMKDGVSTEERERIKTLERDLATQRARLAETREIGVTERLGSGLTFDIPLFIHYALAS